MITRKPEHLKTFDYLGLTPVFPDILHVRGVGTSWSPNKSAQFVRRSSEPHPKTASQLSRMLHAGPLHLLVEGQPKTPRPAVHLARQAVFGISLSSDLRKALWQRYGFEHTLRSQEGALSVARYILENPVRAKLAEGIGDYPFSGSNVYPMEQILEAVQLEDNWYERSG